MTLTDSDRFLDPSDRNVAALMARRISGPIAMLNLLRLREIADYSRSPNLAPVAPISGRAVLACLGRGSSLMTECLDSLRRRSPG
jgi:hypothetical protein